MQLGDTYIEQQNIISHGTPSSEHAETNEEKRRRTFMDSLGFDSMDSRLATIGAAHAETCRWLFDTDEYIRWRDPDFRKTHGGFLWIKGKPGAGKSTLIKHASKHMRKHNARVRVLSFFYNARGHELEKTTQGMYRSLLHQLYVQCPDRLPDRLPKDLSNWEKNGWPLEILQDMLRNALFEFENDRKLVFFIDALDECPEQAIRLAVEYLWNLGELATLRGDNLCVCFASRHYPNVTIQRHEAINLDNQAEHQQDISTFVHTTLRGTKALRKELGEEISRKSCGVFLWAALVVHTVNEKFDHGATRSQLVAQLEAVPTSIEELIGSLLREHDAYLLPTLQWVLFSKIPLSVPQLYFAIVASVGSWTMVSWSDNDVDQEQMRAFILNASRGLVGIVTSRVYESDRLEVQLIHETVREYFLAGGLTNLDSTLCENLEAQCHARLSLCCQLYIEHAMSAMHESQEIHLVEAFRRHSKADRLKQFPCTFLFYVYDYTFWHTQTAFLGNALQLSSVDTLPWTAWAGFEARVIRKSPSSPNLLNILLAYECQDLVRALLERQLTQYRPKGFVAPVGTATAGVDVPRLDLDTGHGHRTRTPLIRAVQARYKDIVSLLLHCGADPNRTDIAGDTPMFYAVTDHFFSFEIIELLFRYGVDPNTRCSRGTLLEVAIRNRDRGSAYGLVELLLERGARANGHGSNLGAPLATIAASGSEEMARLLLADGADVDGHVANRPLHSAVASSRLSMVRLLLAQGANANALDRTARTALHEVAECKGNTYYSNSKQTRNAIAQVLLDGGADTNAVDRKSNTALILAFDRGRFDLATLLIKHGADLTIPRHKQIAAYLHKIGAERIEADLSDSDSGASTSAQFTPKYRDS